MEEELISLKDYASTIRDMVRHENDLTNQRLTWMSTLNGLMLTGLGFIWGKPYDQQVICVLYVLGVVICFSAFLSLRAAEDARFLLYSLWKEKNIPKSTIPPVIGWVKVNRFARMLLPWNVLPWALIITWSVLFIVNIVRPG